MTEIFLFLIVLLRFLPLKVLRTIGWVLSFLLWTFAKRRRHIVRTNLKLCFPTLDAKEIERLGRKHFTCVLQALLDRSWLWHAPERTVRSRVRVTGDPTALELLKNSANSLDAQPLVIFAPHFVGLDAGWTGLALNSGRELTTIFTQQSSAEMDAWVYAGRMRFGRVSLFRKVQGVAEIVRSLKTGAALYLLPDMDFGAKDAVFVSFYGQSAATVTSLSRFAKISKARVLSVATELVADGYEVRVSSLWEAFPSEDATADTQRMNTKLEDLVSAMPEQYYWVHRRFKTRPEGETSLY